MTAKKQVDGIVMLHNLYTRLEHVVPMPEPGVRVELDLGCGDGEFALALAERCPDVYVIAADMLLGRVRKVQKRVLRDGMDNLHVLKSESRVLISRTIPDAFVDRVHLLCPDPWPKTKHRCHRLITSDIMAQFARILKPGGVFHFSTDNAEYLETTDRTVAGSGLFAPSDSALIADVADIKTGFEMLWESGGKHVTHRAWQKLP
jgi:tRNA (guanine-N7-)-methyltransferase